VPNPESRIPDPEFGRYTELIGWVSSICIIETPSSRHHKILWWNEYAT
jgi:hypothetical protein